MIYLEINTASVIVTKYVPMWISSNFQDDEVKGFLRSYASLDDRVYAKQRVRKALREKNLLTLVSQTTRVVAAAGAGMVVGMNSQPLYVRSEGRGQRVRKSEDVESPLEVLDEEVGVSEDRKQKRVRNEDRDAESGSGVLSEAAGMQSDGLANNQPLHVQDCSQEQYKAEGSLEVQNDEIVVSAKNDEIERHMEHGRDSTDECMTGSKMKYAYVHSLDKVIIIPQGPGGSCQKEDPGMCSVNLVGEISNVLVETNSCPQQSVFAKSDCQEWKTFDD